MNCNSRAALTALLLLVAGVAHGQECIVSATPIAFGRYLVLSLVPLDTTGQITVTCKGALSYTIALGPGENSGGTFVPRKMIRNGEAMNYNLYIDAARTKVWGDGTGTTFVQSVTGTVGQIPALQDDRVPGKRRSLARKLNLAAGNRSDTFTIFGRIPPRQAVGAGTFSDRITVTVFF